MGQGRAVADGRSATPVEAAGPRAAGRAGEHRRAARRAAACPRSCAPSPSPARWPTPSPRWSRGRPIEHKVDVLEAVDVERPRRAGPRPGPRSTWPSCRSPSRSAPTWPRAWRRSSASSSCASSWPAIRKELGEGDDDDAGDDYRAKLAELDRCRRRSRDAVDKEIDRLERTSQQSPEQGWIRTWLDRVLDLPWGKRTDDQLDLAEARAVLDADHNGLDDVKDRIVEFLAVRKLRRRAAPPSRRRRARRRPPRGDGAIIALVGPPGVGKTSLGESRRPGHGPQVRAGRPRRRARRGRDPRPPAHLRRRPARAASSGPSPRPGP